jgi:hypothetical protein
MKETTSFSLLFAQVHRDVRPPQTTLETMAVELYKPWWPGPGSNRRPSAFQADAHTD